MSPNPRGWLVRVASRRLIDQWRADHARSEREQRVAPRTEDLVPAPADRGLTVVDPDRDDSRTLLLLTCHPALSRPPQVALTLRAVAGLSTDQIARASSGPD